MSDPTKSPTPRTRNDSDDFARQLERELAEARDELLRWKEQLSLETNAGPTGDLMATSRAWQSVRAERDTLRAEVERLSGLLRLMEAGYSDLRAQLAARDDALKVAREALDECNERLGDGQQASGHRHAPRRPHPHRTTDQAMKLINNSQSNTEVKMRLINPSKDELNARFAEKVAGIYYTDMKVSVKDGQSVWLSSAPTPRFTDSMDAVLPYLERGWWRASKHYDGYEVHFVKSGFNEARWARDRILPIACVIAILRAEGDEIEYPEGGQ